MKTLVVNLEKPQHVVNGGNSTCIEDLKRQIEKGSVFIKFTETQGQTDLCITLDKENSDLSQLEFSNANGMVHLEGESILNFEKVRCVADISLDNLEGVGSLRLLTI